MILTLAFSLLLCCVETIHICFEQTNTSSGLMTTTFLTDAHIEVLKFVDNGNKELTIYLTTSIYIRVQH